MFTISLFKDERLSSYDKADDEALQSALIRSVYDSGNRENGPVVVHQSFGSQDEEVSCKGRKFLTYSQPIVGAKISY